MTLGTIALIIFLAASLIALILLLCICRVAGDCSRMEEENGGSMFVPSKDSNLDDKS